MNQTSQGIVRWLEQKRRTERAWAVVLSVVALASGLTAFLVMTLVSYAVLSVVCGGFVQSVAWRGLAALGLTAVFFARTIKWRRHPADVVLDPMGLWILQDISAFGPRLVLEGWSQVRRCRELGEFNVTACARALAYLAEQNRSVTWDELIQHCGQGSSEHLREQLALLDGVLFLGEDSSRVILMEPFRLRLRSMLDREPHAGKATAPPPPFEPAPRINEALAPEKLSVYDLLGVSRSASVREIKAAYRKRVKECHPDLFSGMGQPAKDLAERWTRALNAAYAKLNPRHGTEPERGVSPQA